ncbi:MAG: lamin tail domain-containing protein [Marinilabiliaceae bacterium]|nr:lamin tail domain-containing protein [Marinilabiliaceae bacterium]
MKNQVYKIINCRNWLLYLAIFIFIPLFYVNAQTVRINEFLALNESGLTDEDGDYSDWIEIFNPTTASINLNGYSLTDDSLLKAKWVFPNVTINAGEYLIVYASGKAKSVAGSQLHTNFKLSGDGEYFGFFNLLQEPVTVFTPSFAVQKADASYGYFQNGYINFSTPTPGADNGTASTVILPMPEFSRAHGFYDNSFSLNITCEYPGAKIYYTTDGSVPTATNGTLFSNTITISKTSIVRAVASLEGALDSKISTSTYLFVSDIIHQPNNPAGYPSQWGPYCQITGTAIADYEMDPELIGDATIANNVKLALKDLPTISLVTDKDNFFKNSTDPSTGGIYIYTGTPVGDTIGRGWERPASFEYFDAKDSITMQIDCAVQLHGGHSRLPEKSPKHSLRVEFKSDYGPSKLNFPFFGEDGTDEFNSIIFISGFCNSWVHHSSEERNRAQFTRDAWAKDTQKEMGHLATRNSFAHLYINGLYWGVYSPSERLNADFAASYLEGKEEDFDVIKDYTEVVDGTINAWNSMMALARSGMDSDENYQKIQGNNVDGTPNPDYPALLDVENLIDYMLINMYGGNTDWDHHNWAAIRNRVKPGKGFKFICWDSEHVLKTVNENVVSEKNSNCPSELFQLLTNNENFRRLVADKVQKHCFNNGLLSPERSVETWMNREKEINLSVDAESARWGDYRRDVHPYQTSGPFALYTKENQFLTQQAFMLNTYFPQRTSVFVNQFKNAGLFTNVTAPSFKINGADAINGIVENGDILTMSTPEGTIYYTLDGTDPVVWEKSETEDPIVIVAEGASKKALVPTSDIGSEWYSSLSYNDASWMSSVGNPGGVGYDSKTDYLGSISLNMSTQMINKNTSCYVRIPFTVTADQKANNSVMTLNIKYDDGFIVYLNGQKIVWQNAPSLPVWNSTSTSGHEANAVESFDISAYINSLNEGDNLLAIHALNQSLTSSDFLVLASVTLSNNIQGAGSIANNALSYSGPIILDKSVRVKARAYYNNEWSAVNDKFFIIPDNYNDIKITEVHYHPIIDEMGDDDKYEFVEIKNTGSSILDIGDMTFVDGVEFRFPQETELQPGAFVVLAANDDAFYSRYGFWPYDDYKGQLNNDGEWVKVISSFGDTICNFKFNDGVDWPQTPDGDGHSLVPTEYNPTNNQNSADFWRASYRIGGSPGEDDTPVLDVVELEMDNTGVVLLSQNYPNPFENITYIDFQLPEDAKVRLEVFDMMGRVVAVLTDGNMPAGLHQVSWSSDNSNAGVYYYRLLVKNNDRDEFITKKMLKR